MNPLQTELLARELTERRSRIAAHPFPPLDPTTVPPRRRPLALARALAALVAYRPNRAGTRSSVRSAS